MIDPAELYRIYSTGEVARILGRSSTNIKALAKEHHLEVPTKHNRLDRIGQPCGDWCWQAEHVAKLRRIVNTHTTATK